MSGSIPQLLTLRSAHELAPHCYSPRTFGSFCALLVAELLAGPLVPVDACWPMHRL